MVLILSMMPRPTAPCTEFRLGPGITSLWPAFEWSVHLLVCTFAKRTNTEFVKRVEMPESREGTGARCSLHLSWRGRVQQGLGRSVVGLLPGTQSILLPTGARSSSWLRVHMWERVCEMQYECEWGRWWVLACSPLVLLSCKHGTLGVGRSAWSLRPVWLSPNCSTAGSPQPAGPGAHRHPGCHQEAHSAGGGEQEWQWAEKHPSV